MDNKYLVEVFLNEIYEREMAKHKGRDSVDRKKISLNFVVDNAYKEYCIRHLECDEESFAESLNKFYGKIDDEIREEEIEKNDKLYLMEKIKELDYKIYKEKKSESRFSNKISTYLITFNILLVLALFGYIYAKDKAQYQVEKEIGIEKGKDYFENARILHKKGDYEEAYKFYKMSSEDGYSQSDYFLGFFYYGGKIVEKNYEKAFFYWQRAFENGVEEASYSLAMLYLKGYGVEKDVDKSKEYLKKAISVGKLEAYFSLGSIFYIEKNYKEAAKIWEAGYSKGDKDSAKSLANLYLYGIGVEKDKDKSKEIIKKIENN